MHCAGGETAVPAVLDNNRAMMLYAMAEQLLLAVVNNNNDHHDDTFQHILLGVGGTGLISSGRLVLSLAERTPDAQLQKVRKHNVIPDLSRSTWRNRVKPPRYLWHACNCQRRPFSSSIDGERLRFCPAMCSENKWC